MEFEEMKKIWDAQNQSTLFVLNEQALHNRIVQKKAQAGHITRVSEILAIGVNLVGGGFVLGMNVVSRNASVWMNAMAGWMFVTAIYVVINRVKRLARDRKFDRSIAGDLDHAIATATYQVRLSNILRLNALPIGIFLLGGMWETGRSFWFSAGLLLFFALTFYLSGWEHNYYERRKHELEMLRGKL
ncbi:MAG TPA: hypothetical protein VG737_08340 [Cyclobacteriaceae bacterium]|nr:hypothetical protein [Cyclobacteriaceae bacterium]